MVNLAGHPEYKSVKAELEKEYQRLREKFKAPDYENFSDK